MRQTGSASLIGVSLGLARQLARFALPAAAFGAATLAMSSDVLADPHRVVGEAACRSALDEGEPAILSSASLRDLANARDGRTRVYVLEQAPGVFLIDFPSLEAQARTLNRLAAFIEKSDGVRDRIVSEGEMRQLTKGDAETYNRYYLGHDYDAAKLAKFFSRARTDEVVLNACERGLLDFLVRSGVVVDTGTAYAPSSRPAVVVTISRAADGDASRFPTLAERRNTLFHELSHAEFATNESYRRATRRYWQSLPAKARLTIRRGLGYLGYDTSDERLVVDEFQAYLLWCGGGVFMDLELRKSGTSFEDLRRRFIASWDSSALRIMPSLPLAEGRCWVVG